MQQYRFKAAPIVSIILKIAAALLVIVFTWLSIFLIVEAVKGWAGGEAGPYGMTTPAIKEFGKRMITLAQPVIFLLVGIAFPAMFWAISDMLLASRQIEMNTRVAAGLKYPEEEVIVPEAPPAE